MEALALLARARAAGYRVRIVNGELILRGPKGGHDALITDLRAAKTELLRCLCREPESTPTTEGASGDGGFQPRPSAPNVVPSDVLARSEPFCAPVSDVECRCCRGTRWWRLRAGCPWVCARCYPSARANAELEWREGCDGSPASTTPGGPLSHGAPPRSPARPAEPEVRQ